MLEEETLPFYKHEQYYPVRIGKIINYKQRVIGRLGYGAYSTTWLCRELRYSTNDQILLSYLT